MFKIEYTNQMEIFNEPWITELKKNNEPWILKAKWFRFHSQHQNIMSWTGYSSDWYRPRITKTQAWAVYERSSLKFDIFFFFLFFIIRV